MLSDQITDVFRDPVDVAIRYGKMDDASYVALPLMSDNRRVLVAAPAYVERRGALKSLGALANQDCLMFKLQGRVYDKWAFPAAKGKRTVQMFGPLVCDDADAARRLAIVGEGIATNAGSMSDRRFVPDDCGYFCRNSSENSRP